MFQNCCVKHIAKSALLRYSIAWTDIHYASLMYYIYRAIISESCTVYLSFVMMVNLLLVSVLWCQKHSYSIYDIFVCWTSKHSNRTKALWWSTKTRHKHSIDLKKPLIKQGDHVIKDYDVQSIHFSILWSPPRIIPIYQKKLGRLVYIRTMFGGLAILNYDILLPITPFYKMCLHLRSSFKIYRVVESGIVPFRTI